MAKYSVISLFSGCGGFDLGVQGGFDFLGNNYPKTKLEVKWAGDINKQAVATYTHNFKASAHCEDLRDSLASPSFPKRANVVLGGFPCQPFSHAGKRLGLADPRGTLYEAMITVLKKVQPEIFIAENVKGLLTHENGETFKRMLLDFEKAGYRLSYSLINVSKLGVPQMRERVILVGTREDLPKLVLADTLGNLVTASEALSQFESLNEGSVNGHYWSKARQNKGQGNSPISAHKPAPTIRAEHHGNIEFHYALPRRLSARECATLQSFPLTFEFPGSTSEAYRQIGNAVPPLLGYWIGCQVEAYLRRFHVEGH